MADVPLIIISDNASSERRVAPSWSIATLKARLEPVTGIPAGSQRLALVAGGGAGDQTVPVEAADEHSTLLGSFPLRPYMELKVTDTRPPAARPNYTDTSNVEKYVMPEEEYAKKTDSVLAWKKANRLGRFDPDAGETARALEASFEAEVERRGIVSGARCRVDGDDSRRGAVRYVGPVPEITTGGGGPWVGVHLDEPVGRNDGTIGGKRYWGEDEKTADEPSSGMKHGLLVRPPRVEVGDFPVMDVLAEMEEI